MSNMPIFFKYLLVSSDLSDLLLVELFVTSPSTCMSASLMLVELMYACNNDNNNYIVIVIIIIIIIVTIIIISTLIEKCCLMGL